MLETDIFEKNDDNPFKYRWLSWTLFHLAHLASNGVQNARLMGNMEMLH